MNIGIWFLVTFELKIRAGRNLWSKTKIYSENCLFNSEALYLREPVRSMTSHIFGPGDSLTLWRSGRILAKGARGPGFNPRWKLGVKFPT